MPVLPHLYRRIATAASDTRILDSRQLANSVRSIATQAKQLFSRAPSLSRRNASGYFCRNGIIQDCYITGGPAPGAVAGIVLGSIAGFLLLMWILWTLSTGGGFIRTSNLEEEDVVVRRRSRSPGRSRRSTHNRTSTYQAEMRRSSPRRERVIRQERIVRDVPVTSRNERSRVRESIIVEERPERRMDGDDIVEVIEEHSSIGGGAPPPRRKSGRR